MIATEFDPGDGDARQTRKTVLYEVVKKPMKWLSMHPSFQCKEIAVAIHLYREYFEIL